MLKSLQNAVESGKKEFEIGEYMTRLSADIISRTEFDSSYEKGKQIFHLFTVLQHLCAQASRHLCFPGSRFFPSKYNRNKIIEDGSGETANGDHTKPKRPCRNWQKQFLWD